jgi:predicted lysophospholipase L1 biosynthesis ABC-type transport system permease subunit
VPAEAPSDTPDTFDLVTDAHEGTFAAQYAWTAASILDSIHGIRFDTPGGGALPVLVNEGLLQRVNRQAGDTLRIAVGTHEFDVRVAGTFVLFPTFDPGEGDLMVADLAATRLELNRVPGSGGVNAVSEVWVNALPGTRAESISLPPGSRPSATLESLAERERFRLDPLIETGWQGMLLIAFLTIAVLSSLGTLIYSYLAAQARRLDFAVLRTMGLSSNQILGLVGFEQILVVVIGIVSGSLIGSRLGVLLLASLELTESGERVTPPYVMEINWFAAGVAYGVMALAFVLSVVFLVVFFSRLSLHRMLRIGEA